MNTLHKYFQKRPIVIDDDHKQEPERKVKAPKLDPKPEPLLQDDEQDPAHPGNLLRTLIRRIKKHHSEKYREALDRGDESYFDEVYGFLRPEILDLYKSGNLKSYRDLKKLGAKDNFRQRVTAVYLHVLDTPEGERYYGGQADDLWQRVVKQHQNETFRKGYPSLHYKALEAATDNFFLIVGVLPAIDADVDKKLRCQHMNTFEMWACLIFRSLAPKHLKMYLPASIANDEFSQLHLNVQLPLHQGQVVDKKEWHDIMRVTTDPLKKAEYARFIEDRTQQLLGMNERKNDEKMQKALLGEKRKPCVGAHKNMMIQHRGLLVGLPLGIQRYEDLTVHFKIEVQPEGQGDHPNFFVRGAPPGDICRRLGILISGLDKRGQPLSLWAKKETSGENTIKRANTLTDLILGVPLDVIEKTPRRFLDVYKSRGRNKIVYT